MKTTLTSMKMWLTAHQQVIKKVAIIAGIMLAIIIFFVSVNKIIDMVHDYRYNRQQDNLNKAGRQSEANANQHITNANTAANQLQELQENENTIKQKQTEQNTKVSAAANRSTSTRENLNRALNQNVPDRDADAGTDDDQLRTDANRAADIFNRARIKKAATPKP